MSDDQVRGVSARELARILGVSDTAVRKAAAKDSGRIRKLPNGLFDPIESERLWKANTDATQQRRVTERTDASEEPTPAPAPPTRPADEKVVQFPGDASGRLAEHQRRNLEKHGKGPPAVESQDATTASLNKKIMQERLRKFQLENDLAERVTMERGPMLMVMETLGRDTREAWQQFVDKFAPGIAERLGLSDRKHDVFIALKESVDQHLLETISKIEPDRYFKRIK